MKKLAAFFAPLMLAASAVHAQADSFKGISLALNASLASPTTEYSQAGQPLPSDTSTGTVVSLQSRYYFKLSDQYLLGVGLNKSLSKLRSGTLTGIDSNLKDRISIDVSPAYALTDDTLLFAKLAFISGTFSSQTDDNTSTATGVGYGLGARYLLTKSMFLQASYDAEKYNDLQFGSQTQKVKASSVSLGVGFKF